ncbi:MAG: GTP-binding protein, partial [Pseudomonadota bacterium]
SVKQVAVADRIVLTKSDLVDPGTTSRLLARLVEINLSAPVIDSAGADVEPEALITQDLHDPAGKMREVDRWMQAPEPARHEHTDGISSFALVYDRALDWTAFGIWMTMLLNRHGDRVLRIKGLLNVADVDTPVLINGVQHVVHPPVHLDDWPDKDRRSRLVFIVRDIERAKIETSLAAFNGLANPDVGTLDRVALSGG